MHQVAFFSHWLSPVEGNYDVGDRELLVTKVALEEWKYLLEGAAHSILIYTDHKNLEYLQSARCLRPRQARWVLFFTRFFFHIIYRPGSKNVKPDALSRMYDDPKELSILHTILPAGSFLLLQTDLLSQIKQVSMGVSSPPGVTLVVRDELLWQESQIFVPEEIRVKVLRLFHDHLLVGHFSI